MSEKIAEAVQASREGMNCCQSIIATYGPPLGLPPEVAVRLGSCFGGGLGRAGEVCGALTGATMVLGWKYGPLDAKNREARELGYALVRELVGIFRERRGAVTCRELLNCDISTAENYALAKERGVMKELCPMLVQDAAEILEAIIAREDRV
ncbi:MAG: C-GCAxxG-C-C family protein [Smithellaceae bacterium]|nr:C-GCAxxG-C-C family protein [Smithellaceae bacterium]